MIVVIPPAETMKKAVLLVVISVLLLSCQQGVVFTEFRSVGRGDIGVRTPSAMKFRSILLRTLVKVRWLIWAAFIRWARRSERS